MKTGFVASRMGSLVFGLVTGCGGHEISTRSTAGGASDPGAVPASKERMDAGGVPPLVFTVENEWAMGTTEVSPRGACVFRQEEDGTPGAIYGVRTGHKMEVGSFSNFAWLP